MTQRKKGTSSVNKKPPRKDPDPCMKEKLLRKNKGVCCVCKERGLGLQFHHIDGNPSNTVEENLAVLCAEAHDKHHRPHRYSHTRHPDLSPDQIKHYKESWEDFVEEASKPNTEVLGFVILYGEGETVSHLRLTFQWGDQVMWERMIHDTDFPSYVWKDEVYKSRDWLGEHIWINIVPELLPIKFCEICASNGKYDSRRDPKLYGSVTKKYTDAAWDTDSCVSLYIDPYRPFLSFGVLLRGEPIHSVYIYKQGKSVSTFCSEPSCECHSSSDEKKLSPENLEEQVKYVLNTLLVKWEPARYNLFTLKDNAPVLLDGITLHDAWYEDNEFNLSDLVESIMNVFHPVISVSKRDGHRERKVGEITPE
jgi:hypothetical protein